MAAATSSAALVLSAVLLVAAAGKLRNPARTAAGFERLGLPVPRALARAVPAAEVAVGVALVVVPGWGGVAAFCLLAGFTAYLAAVVRSGRRVPCGCFGSTGDRPVSARDLLRNVVLLAAAALAVASPGALVLRPATVAPAVLLLLAAAARRGRAGGPSSRRDRPRRWSTAD